MIQVHNELRRMIFCDDHNFKEDLWQDIPLDFLNEYGISWKVMFYYETRAKYESFSPDMTGKICKKIWPGTDVNKQWVWFYKARKVSYALGKN